MNKPLSDKAFNSGNADLAFTLNELANKRKNEGAKVLNVALGTFYNKDGSVSSFSLIDELMKKHCNDSSRGYASIDGGDLFKTSVKSWVFSEYHDDLLKKYGCEVCATPGGTGALYLAIRNYSSSNPILIPDIGWQNYKSICSQMNKTYESYNMFSNNKFDVDGIIDWCQKSIREFGSCTLLINDPCQNPTGYSLSDEEWDCLIDKFNGFANEGVFNLILDIAYMDLAVEPRRFFKHILHKHMSFNTLLCFSGSKLLGVYGARLGAIICLNEDTTNCSEFLKASKLTARAVWSNCNHLIINVFSEICGKESYKELLKKELDSKKVELKNRYIKSRNLFDKVFDCEPLPYKEGFFVVYPVENALKAKEDLIRKGIFALPIGEKFIRISICSFIDD